MAEDQGGQGKSLFQSAPWLKLFGAFKIALDPKKLLLAGAGILSMALGWWFLAVFFGLFRANPPQWSSYQTENQTDDQMKKAWEAFKHDRQNWNLFHALAGPAPASLKEARRQDAADLANSLEEYQRILDFKQQLQNFDTPIVIKKDTLTIKNTEYSFEPTDPKFHPPQETVTPAEIQVVNAKDKLVQVRDVRIKITAASAEKAIDQLQELTKSARSKGQLLAGADASKRVLVEKAIKLKEGESAILPFGKLRTWPWYEYRGPNPYLMVTMQLKNPDGTSTVPWEPGHFLSWLGSDQVPVLLEPLFKFIGPVVYLFRPDAGGWNRVYLFLVILWTLAVWAFFGGAITRMAVVQVARHNEKISMMEALRFARARCQSFFSAPLFPLVFLAIITFFLLIFGLFEGFTWIIGDIFIAGLLWPLVLIAGLVMAVVLVGLIGWPLMYATISAEGSDSFDALSRSYSYVYQAPWHYVWYSFVALIYGAILVFFVGFMGSLLVYMGSWGMSTAPYLEKREPSYLFIYTPTSFGWRDLLLHQSTHSKVEKVPQQNGTIGTINTVESTENYDITWYNRFGAFLVSVWIGLLFLLVVGFGYSYFWTAAAIIYLLLRRKVDDTEMDEIHMEEEEEEPFMEPPPASSPAAPPPPSSGGVTMVEAPSLRNPPAEPSETHTPPPPSDGPSPPPPSDGPSSPGGTS
jgi:hypothetical protein